MGRVSFVVARLHVHLLRKVTDYLSQEICSVTLVCHKTTASVGEPPTFQLTTLILNLPVAIQEETLGDRIALWHWAPKNCYIRKYRLGRREAVFRKEIVEQ